MSHQAARQQVGVALFPFLAVLICTMGALIVLLVLLMQQARLDATIIGAAKSAASAGSDQARLMRERLEDAQWRQQLLERSRTEKTAELADSRARLAHLEEHSQRLAAQAQELLERAKAIDEGRTLGDDALAAARANAARLETEVEQRKREIESKKKLTDGQEWYALIPYEGAAGTRRRPIYVECTEFGVIIQPEGLILRSEDFLGPLGPGNPLDMALRATREYLETTLGTAAGRPYPLLVVRPGGVVAYGAARAAMKAWDDEFGYELIGDEKQLDFGAPDPALSARLSKAIADARARQATMMAMMPRRYQNETPIASAGSDTSGGSAPRLSGASGVQNGSSGASGLPAGRVGGMSQSPGIAGDTGRAGGGSSIGAGGAAHVGRNAGDLRSGMVEQSGDRSTTGSGESITASGESITGSGDRSTSAARGGAALQAGAGSPAGGSPGGSSSLGTPTGTPGPSFSFGEKKSSPPGAASGGSSAKSSRRPGSGKGSNWALPGAKPNAIGVTRPIRMAVLPDRIVLTPEEGDSRSAQVVPLAPELTEDNVNHFVTTVQKEVEGWGLAVKDGYWKPVLQAEVAPGAERHFLNLQTALGGSGIDINRR